MKSKIVNDILTKEYENVKKMDSEIKKGNFDGTSEKSWNEYCCVLCSTKIKIKHIGSEKVKCQKNTYAVA